MKSHSQLILSTFIVLVLAGCNTAAQRDAANTTSVIQQAGGELQACLTSNYNNLKYASIVPHLPAPENKFMPTMEQMSDDNLPTLSESKLLIKYRDDGLPCKEMALNKIGNVAPSVAEVLADGMVKCDIIMMKLVKRKSSWGNSMQELQQQIIAGQRNLAMVSQQMQNNFQISHQQELSRRQAASDSLMQWSIQQQYIDAANRQTMTPSRPTNTNCRRSVYGLNCTSW